jgi:gamma-glutamyltranspeptidase
MARDTNVPRKSFSTRPELRGTFGMVASTHWLASAVGMAVLERGGNAFDAAVAAGFTLQVVEPHMNGPGGDQQDQWALHAFLAHVHQDLDLQAAIDAPNHHTDAFPSSFYPRETRPRHVAVEERTGSETIEGLRRRGHEVEVSAPWTLGRVSAVGLEPGGIVKAGADARRRQGYAVGR